MSIDYQGIIGALQQYNPLIAGVVVTDFNGNIKYATSNWNPDPTEIRRVINAWSGGSVSSVTISGV
ncbi:MAG: hypothetical protein ACTSRA_19520, partial [Promethearchaeota archaeon]